MIPAPKGDPDLISREGCVGVLPAHAGPRRGKDMTHVVEADDFSSLTSRGMALERFL
jgi:hypothetical protein